MKVTCPISGIITTLTTPTRGSVKSPHPMLSANIKCAKLADWYLEPWAKGELPQVETHLLGCAYLLKLPINTIALEPLEETTLAKWDRFWSSNMEKLAKLALRLEGKEVNYKYLPKLTVTMDTLGALPDWVSELEFAINLSAMPISDKARELNRASYKAGTEVANNPSRYLAEDQIEQVVRRALNGSLLSNNESKALPVILSDWALKVTEFPEHTKMRWQRIIQTIFHQDYINQILMSDIKLEQVKALEEHLQLNTPAHAIGTSHISILMDRLHKVIPVFEDFSPVISARKKTGQDDLIAALDGIEPNSSSAQQRASVASGTVNGSVPKLTLAERLAQRMAAIRSAKV